ncbi:MAG: DNA recombination protein RmuC [Elusimicrobiota bacterium]|nr:DNA recombination protein RmuC [Endomicrobiia bacterium]MDW8166236.1 DNA recombination protein RmuC [Elusimicrobiota bacterium]
MNLIIILLFFIILFLVYLIFYVKRLTEGKFTEFNTKLEFSSQLISELKTSIFNSLSLLQNHINQTINQVSTTDSTLKTQLELLRNSLNEQISATVKNLNLQIKTTTEATSTGFQLVSKQIDERLKGTTEMFSQLTEMVSKLSASAELLKENTEELRKSLSSIKLRGSFGEELLEKILLEVFPTDKVKFKYHVNPHSGEQVEAAVIFKDKVFPIDSKFNVDKFLKLDEAKDDISRREAEKDLAKSIKEQIDKIAEKYVLPKYGAEYAFMYIPVESGFLKILNLKLRNDESIMRYAIRKHVIICSPQTLLPYLQFIVMGLQAEQIAKNILVLREQLQSLLNNINKFANKYSTLGRHIKDAYEKFVEAESDLKMLEIQTKNVASIDFKESKELPEKNI